MTPQETVQTLMNALQTGDFKTARALLSTNFRFSGSVPEPLGPGPWIGLCANLKTAFPNLDYHFAIPETLGTVVSITERLTGTHTANLNLTALNMGMLPASGTRFSMAHEQGEVTVHDQKVTAWNMLACEGAGLMALLPQLTCHMPSKRRPAAFSASRWDDARNLFLVPPQQREVAPHG